VTGAGGGPDQVGPDELTRYAIGTTARTGDFHWPTIGTDPRVRSSTGAARAWSFRCSRSIADQYRAGLAGALRGADQRPAPSAPGQNERPAPRAPERPCPGCYARVIRRQGPARGRSPAQPGSAQPACSTLRLKSLKN
jgi:hypothetical protein